MRSARKVLQIHDNLFFNIWVSGITESAGTILEKRQLISPLKTGGKTFSMLGMKGLSDVATLSYQSTIWLKIVTQVKSCKKWDISYEIL